MFCLGSYLLSSDLTKTNSGGGSGWTKQKKELTRLQPCVIAGFLYQIFKGGKTHDPTKEVLRSEKQGGVGPPDPEFTLMPHKMGLLGANCSTPEPAIKSTRKGQRKGQPQLKNQGADIAEVPRRMGGGDRKRLGDLGKVFRHDKKSFYDKEELNSPN